MRKIRHIDGVLQYLWRSVILFCCIFEHVRVYRIPRHTTLNKHIQLWQIVQTKLTFACHFILRLSYHCFYLLLAYRRFSILCSTTLWFSLIFPLYVHIIAGHYSNQMQNICSSDDGNCIENTYTYTYDSRSYTRNAYNKHDEDDERRMETENSSKQNSE